MKVRTITRNCMSRSRQVQDTVKIRTVNRNCLSQSQYTTLLSTPRGHAWTGSPSLSFIIEKCRKAGGRVANGNRRKAEKRSSFDAYTAVWQHFVKQFLQSAEHSLAPSTRIILTKILPSRVNIPDQKLSSYRNTQTEICNFLSNLSPNCDSMNWKRDSFRTLSSLVFNYIVQVLCSGRILKKRKMAQVILNKINDLTHEYVTLNSPDNFLQGVQIFIANMFSPWIEHSINDICSKSDDKDSKIKKSHKTKNKRNFRKDTILNKDRHTMNKKLLGIKMDRNKKKFKKSNQENVNKGNAYQTAVNDNTINEIEDQAIGNENKHSNTNKIIQNKRNRLKFKSEKRLKTNQIYENDKITNTIVKHSLSPLNPNKATKTIKTKKKSKKVMKSTSVISVVNKSEKMNENLEIVSNSVFVKHPGGKNETKKKTKNKKKSSFNTNDTYKKFKKGKIPKTDRKPINVMKSKSLIAAVGESEKVIEKLEILSDSVLVKRPGGKNETKKKTKNKEKSSFNTNDTYKKSKKGKIPKTDRKPINFMKSKSSIAAVGESEKVIEKLEILSNSVLVKRPSGKNETKQKTKNKNKLNLNKSGTNKKSKKGKISKNNGKPKTVMKLPSVIDSNTLDKSQKLNENILGSKSNRDQNGHVEYRKGEKSNDKFTAGNELSKSAIKLHNGNKSEADVNRKNHFMNNNGNILPPDSGTENTHGMLDTTSHDGRNDDDGQNKIGAVANHSKKSRSYDGDGKLLASGQSGGPTAAIPNGITDYDSNINNGGVQNVTDYDGNEDDGGAKNVTYNYGGHAASVADDFSAKKHDANLWRGEELLKYNHDTSLDITDDDRYNEANKDYDNGSDDDDRKHIIKNEYGEEFESRVLKDLSNSFLDHENTILSTSRSSSGESQRNCVQRIADGYAQKLLMDNIRYKAPTRTNVCNPTEYNGTKTTYDICKKDGSNYSVHKTILKLCENRNPPQYTMCPLDQCRLARCPQKLIFWPS